MRKPITKLPKTQTAQIPNNALVTTLHPPPSSFARTSATQPGGQLACTRVDSVLKSASAIWTDWTVAGC